MARNKATHFGTCQLCGSRQKLPGGVLAKHGYTARWGFFSGTCPGSDHLPYELSCDLIAAARDRAMLNANSLRYQAGQLRTMDCSTETTAMVNHYFRALSSRSPSGYRWARATITEHDVQTRPDGNRFARYRYAVDAGFGKTVTSDIHAYLKGGSTLPKMIAYLNDNYAKHLEDVARQRDEYADWLKLSLERWVYAPETLQPVAA